jgi:hypothetical protein
VDIFRDATLALETGLTVYAIHAVVELPLAHMTCIAGLAGNFSSLLAQYMFGKPISDKIGFSCAQVPFRYLPRIR